MCCRIFFELWIPMERNGVFICIEGLDGSGKTTHARRLVKDLHRMRLNAEYTTEPSIGEIGKFVRQWILQGRRRVPSVVEALLFAIDRVAHVEEEIWPALCKGRIIVSDRYVYSSLAYQGATGLDMEWIEAINRFALLPDLAIYIDVPPEVVVGRLRGTKSVMESLKVQREVHSVYKGLVEKGTMISVDGNQPIGDVAEAISTVVLNFLRSSGRC
ncbi:MAG: dTMP kinase [Candidatus Bathyarchaeota archaeon]|nr:MAG: dTMP kinase [Candidatus Bathyarchaeota archaeon]